MRKKKLYRKNLIFIQDRYPSNIFLYEKKKRKKFSRVWDTIETPLQRAKKNWNLSIRQIPKINFPLKKLGFFKFPIKKFLFSDGQIFYHFIYNILFRPISEFYTRIKEKRKIEALYGYFDNNFFEKIFRPSKKVRGNSIAVALIHLESHLNMTLAKLGLFPSSAFSYEEVKKKRIKLNKKDIYSISQKTTTGDVIYLYNMILPEKLCGEKFQNNKNDSLGVQSIIQNFSINTVYHFYTKFPVLLKYRYIMSWDIFLNKKSFYPFQMEIRRKFLNYKKYRNSRVKRRNSFSYKD